MSFRFTVYQFYCGDAQSAKRALHTGLHRSAASGNLLANKKGMVGLIGGYPESTLKL